VQDVDPQDQGTASNFKLPEPFSRLSHASVIPTQLWCSTLAYEPHTSCLVSVSTRRKRWCAPCDTEGTSAVTKGLGSWLQRQRFSKLLSIHSHHQPDWCVPTHWIPTELYNAQSRLRLLFIPFFPSHSFFSFSSRSRLHESISLSVQSLLNTSCASRSSCLSHSTLTNLLVFSTINLS
jgi:hypothetical protein